MLRGRLSAPSGGYLEPLHEFEKETLRHYPFLIITVTVFIVGGNIALYQVEPVELDWFWLSGIATLLITYPFSLRVPDLVDDRVREMARTGVLQPAADVPAFLVGLHRAANRYGARMGAALAVVIFIVWLALIVDSSGTRIWSYAVSGMLVETCGAILVGRFVGRALCYRDLDRRCREAGLRLTPGTDHLDGAAGLRSLDAYGAVLVGPILVILTYLVTWLTLITMVPAYERFDEWWGPYVVFVIGFLVIAGVIAKSVWPASIRSVGRLPLRTATVSALVVLALVLLAVLAFA